VRSASCLPRLGIGALPFAVYDPLSFRMDHTLTDRFIAQADDLRRWCDGLSDMQLDAHAVPGAWSMRQLVVHMLDSDLAAGHRMKRIAAESFPLLIAYDETAFAATLYKAVDVALACDLFRLNRLHTGEVLRALPDAAFQRSGIHNQRGRVTLAEMVALYVHHMDHHAPFAAAKRAALGVASA